MYTMHIDFFALCYSANSSAAAGCRKPNRPRKRKHRQNWCGITDSVGYSWKEIYSYPSKLTRIADHCDCMLTSDQRKSWWSRRM